MSRELSTLRIERLNTLLGTLRLGGYAGRDELKKLCGYKSDRTLENDIRFLRRSFGARIRYSRSRRCYVLEDSGRYVLNCCNIKD